MKDHLGFYLGDIGRLMRKHFDVAARDLGVTGAQWRVLLTLLRMPGMNQGQIAERLEVEPITTCRMIDRLEQAGLVERRRDPADRRAWQIYLTDAAEPLLDGLKNVADAMSERGLRGFSDAETRQLHNMLDRLRNNLTDDMSAALPILEMPKSTDDSEEKKVHHG